MKNLEISKFIEAEVRQLEGFLESGLGSHKPKASFQASLKDRLTASNVFNKRKRLASAWVIGLSCALAGAAVYSFGYFIYRHVNSQA